MQVQMELHMKLTCAYARLHQEIVGRLTMHELFIFVTFSIGSQTGTC